MKIRYRVKRLKVPGGHRHRARAPGPAHREGGLRFYEYHRPAFLAGEEVIFVHPFLDTFVSSNTADVSH